MDKEKEDEVMATLVSLQKAQKRQGIGLIIGFVLLFIWVQLPGIWLVAKWLALLYPW